MVKAIKPAKQEMSVQKKQSVNKTIKNTNVVVSIGSLERL